MYFIEKHLKKAADTSEISGVYWSARDLDHKAIGNHHFITLVYKDKEEAEMFRLNLGMEYFMLENDHVPPLLTYYSTMGVSIDDDKNTKIVFNYESDVQSLYEIARKKNTRWNIPDFDYEGHKVEISKSAITYATQQEFMIAVVGKVKNFVLNYKYGKRLPYTLRDHNCACFVNTVLDDLGFDKKTRNQLGEFQGIDWGEEDLFPKDYFIPIIQEPVPNPVEYK